jgi:hypothetical protein
MHITINIGWLLVVGVLVWLAYERGYTAGLEYASKAIDDVLGKD